jgi:pilus assembly protein CpaB
MQAKTIIPLVMGVGVGLLSIKLILDKVQKAEGQDLGNTSIVIAKKSIPTATQITKKMLTTKEIPSALSSEDVFAEVDALVGRVTQMSIPQGISITKRMLAKRGSQPGLRARIPPGLLAISVQVTEASAVAGFLVPGALVDVFSTTSERGFAKTKTTRILSAVEIGAVGQSLSVVNRDGKTVRITKTITLFLNAEQVAVLQTAEKKGSIRLALRGDGDIDDRELDALDEEPSSPPPTVLNPPVQVTSQPIGPASTPQRRQHVVEVRYGSKIDRYVFDASGRRHRNTHEAKPSAAPHDDAKEEHNAGGSACDEDP